MYWANSLRQMNNYLLISTSSLKNETFGFRYMDPITYGDYPRTMRSLVRNRLPKFSKEESEMLKGSFDFLGLNYYTSNFAADAPDFKNRTPNYNTDSLVYKTSKFILQIQCFLF